MNQIPRLGNIERNLAQQVWAQHQAPGLLQSAMMALHTAKGEKLHRLAEGLRGASSNHEPRPSSQRTHRGHWHRT